MKTNRSRLLLSSVLTGCVVAAAALLPASASAYQPGYNSDPAEFYFKPTPGTSRAENYAACVRSARSTFVRITCRLLY